MEQVMRPLTQGLIEECLIELLDRRVLMGLSELLNKLVIMVESLGTENPPLIAGRQGLPSATHATSRAAHDLDELIIRCAFHNLIHQSSGIG
jgi:hypothetical protein